MRIEQANVADATVLASIHAASAIEAYAHIFPPSGNPPTPAGLTPSWAAMLDDPDWPVFVARRSVPSDRGAREEAEMAYGVVAIGPDPDVPTGWLLARLYVHPGSWAEGAGSALHDQALEAAARYTDAVNLWVLEGNDRGRRFYQRRGWTLVPGRFLANDPPDVRDVLYQRSLLPGSGREQ